MKAMILAAGRGTRLAPFTDTRPKVLFPIAGYTLLEITIRYLKKHGVDEFVVNLHHHADQVVEYLAQNKGFGLKYTISDESGKLLNSGGGILKARSFFDDKGDFILTASDVLTDLDLTAMIRFHTQNHALSTLAVKKRDTSRSLLFDKDNRLVGWKNNETGQVKGEQAERALYDLGFSTIHVINARIFDLITETGAFSITDLYLRLMYEHRILGFRHDDTGWIEFGRKERIDQILESEEFKRMIGGI